MIKGNLFRHQFIIEAMHQGERRQLLAASQRLPDLGGTVNAFVSELDEIVEIGESQIIAVVKPIKNEVL